MQVWILIRQLPARGLSPNHEGVHGSLDVRLVLDRAAAPRRHGHQGPVVALQHLGHRVPDARREPLVLALQLRDHERRVAAGSGGGCRRVRVRLLRGHGAGRAGWTARRLRAGLILLLRHDDRFCSQTRDARIQLLQCGFPQQKKVSDAAAVHPGAQRRTDGAHDGQPDFEALPRADEEPLLPRTLVGGRFTRDQLRLAQHTSQNKVI